MGRDGEAAGVENALVVSRINGDIFAHNGIELGSLDGFDTMLGNLAIPASVPFMTRGFWKVLVYFAAMDDTHQLHSTANAEQRDVTIDRCSNQIRFRAILIRMCQ